jgi:hypothetical protein
MRKMTKTKLSKPSIFFKSDIPSEKIDLLSKLKGSKLSKLVRYSWEPLDAAAKQIEEDFHAPASSVFRRTYGCLLITLESGMILGFADRPSEGSVVVWVEQTEEGEKKVEDSVLDDNDAYPIDALDKTYSEELIYDLVEQEISSVSIIKRNNPNWTREVAGEVGIILRFNHDSELIISRNLCENIDDFALVFRDEIDPEILDQLQEIQI